MKKRVLGLLVVTAMIAGLVACGGKNKSDSDSQNPSGNQAQTTEDKKITVWVAENVVEFTKQQAEIWRGLNETNSGFTVEVLPVGVADAAGNMLTDVTGGADLFDFAQDQLTRLVSAGALTAVTGDNAVFVETKNDAGAASAAKVGDVTYAYPVTSDNGYFLYYDKNVISDVSSLEAILEQCEAAGKNFYFDLRSGWYNAAFFMAADCLMTYDTDTEGNFVAVNGSYANEKGVEALKAMIAMTNSPAFKQGSSIGSGTNIGAIVTGAWEAGSADALWGADGYGCAKLPTVSINGEQKQMGGFGGFKLLGIKPQTNSAKLAACHSLAQYLTSAEVQKARFDAVAWGPSNLEAQEYEKVKENKALSALAEQLNYSVGQGQYPNLYWSEFEALADTIMANSYDNMSDEELLVELQKLETKLKNIR